MSEDCLFLNIWAPSNRSNMAVLIHIYGGGFEIGSSDYYEHNPQYLSARTNMTKFNAKNESTRLLGAVHGEDQQYVLGLPLRDYLSYTPKEIKFSNRMMDYVGNFAKKGTISRRLVANGLHSCRPLRSLPLTPPNRRQRLEWCRARSTWMTEWHRVVFSDESRFCLSSDSRRVRVWRRHGERSNPAAIVERPTVRQRGIMVWGAIAYDSRSPLLRIQGTMTAQRYVDDVLRPVTLPYLQGVPNALLSAG
ncbi:BCHE [Cordylochernes scorpioides]|uniref:BCHE n=1 Tax=Cordylochernes scorpioides TaxID=51811 RepID=A0ABY6LB11_9ARAC|nr:BCHE [Cordylochernes scorpioides]